MPNNIYRNSEGYYDPTAGEVLAKCDRKEKSDRRKAIRKANAKARKQAAAESILRAVGGVHIHGFQRSYIKVLRRDNRDGNCKHCAEHQKTLEKVRTSLAKYGAESLARFDQMHEQFQVPSTLV